MTHLQAPARSSSGGFSSPGSALPPSTSNSRFPPALDTPGHEHHLFSIRTNSAPMPPLARGVCVSGRRRQVCRLPDHRRWPGPPTGAVGGTHSRIHPAGSVPQLPMPPTASPIVEARRTAYISEGLIVAHPVHPASHWHSHQVSLADALNAPFPAIREANRKWLASGNGLPSHHAPAEAERRIFPVNECEG